MNINLPNKIYATEDRNIVFIAKSLDGFIAGKKGELDWLHAVPNPDNVEMGFADLMNRIDGIVMGRNTFEIVCNLDGEWLYSKPVFVLSSILSSIPEKFKDKAEIVKGSPGEIVELLHNKGFHQLYIDGGLTIQSFLRSGLIDELVITTIPVLLGEGIPLFGELPHPIFLNHLKTVVYLNQLVQSHYELK